MPTIFLPPNFGLRAEDFTETEMLTVEVDVVEDEVAESVVFKLAAMGESVGALGGCDTERRGFLGGCSIEGEVIDSSMLSNGLLLFSLRVNTSRFFVEFSREVFGAVTVAAFLEDHRDSSKKSAAFTTSTTSLLPSNARGSENLCTLITLRL